MFILVKFTICSEDENVPRSLDIIAEASDPV